MDHRKIEILTPLEAMHSPRGAQNVLVAGHEQLTRENKLDHLLREGYKDKCGKKMFRSTQTANLSRIISYNL